MQILGSNKKNIEGNTFVFPRDFPKFQTKFALLDHIVFIQVLVIGGVCIMLISVTGVYKYFGEKLVLENINATVNAGDKIGLVGINGAGKSTLINLITGRLFADEGDIAKAKNLRIGSLEQNSGPQIPLSRR